MLCPQCSEHLPLFRDCEYCALCELYCHPHCTEMCRVCRFTFCMDHARMLRSVDEPMQDRDRPTASGHFHCEYIVDGHQCHAPTHGMAPVCRGCGRRVCTEHKVETWRLPTWRSICIACFETESDPNMGHPGHGIASQPRVLNSCSMSTGFTQQSSSVAVCTLPDTSQSSADISHTQPPSFAGMSPTSVADSAGKSVQEDSTTCSPGFNS